MAKIFGLASLGSTIHHLGTVICIGGSLIFTFWKGGYLLKNFQNRPLINIYEHCPAAAAGDGSSHTIAAQDWIKGSAILLTSYIAWSAWLVFQGVVYKVYPARLSMNTLICFFASLQSSFLALIFARNPESWKLEWNVQLLTIVHGGLVNSALVYCIQTLCISNKGPVFSATFSPLQLIIAAVFSAIAFAERLHLGSVTGAVLIILGLYSVL